MGGARPNQINAAGNNKEKQTKHSIQRE
jgi:hypothetical protein